MKIWWHFYCAEVPSSITVILTVVVLLLIIIRFQGRNEDSPQRRDNAGRGGGWPSICFCTIFPKLHEIENIFGLWRTLVPGMPPRSATGFMHRVLNYYRGVWRKGQGFPIPSHPHFRLRNTDCVTRSAHRVSGTQFPVKSWTWCYWMIVQFTWSQTLQLVIPYLPFCRRVGKTGFRTGLDQPDLRPGTGWVSFLSRFFSQIQLVSLNRMGEFPLRFVPSQ